MLDAQNDLSSAALIPFHYFNLMSYHKTIAIFDKWALIVILTSNAYQLSCELFFLPLLSSQT